MSHINVRQLILGAGLLWGIVLLIVGFFASFSIGAKDTVYSLIGFALIFILPIVASITARWMPLIAGATLLASVIILLFGYYVSGGVMDVLRVLSRVYIWLNVVFGMAFIAINKQRIP
jgi:hypothetical protein